MKLTVIKDTRPRALIGDIVRCEECDRYIEKELCDIPIKDFNEKDNPLYCLNLTKKREADEKKAKERSKKIKNFREDEDFEWL